MNIDLNINNYTKSKLERLFQLPPNYSDHDIISKENELYTNLMKLDVNVSTKETIILFLKQARDQLMPMEIPKIKVKPKTKIITIDTCVRSQYPLTKAYNYLYKLTEPIKNVTSLKISSIELPVHWYTFSDKSTIILNNDPIRIPEGNYSEKEFETIFNDLSDIQIQIKNKTIFISKEAFSITIATDNLALYKTAGWYIGFRNPTYTSIYNPLESRYEIVSECPYGYHSDYLFLEINDFHETFTTDKIFSIPLVELDNTNIMGRISLHNNTTLHINNGFSTRTYNNPILLERIHVNLLNKYGDLFKLTTDYSISIEVTC